MKNLFALLFILVICLSYSLPLQALEEKASSEVKPADVIRYPLKLGKEVAVVGVNAGRKAVDTTVDTGHAAAQVLTGDVKQVPAIATTPVEGVAEGVGETAEGVVQAPVKAASKE